MSLPSSRLPVPPTSTPKLALPEMTLRSAAAVPPMVLLFVSPLKTMTTPTRPLPRATLPVASVPM
jgi:hypothetical protein